MSFFAIMQTCVKWLSDLSVYELVFFRALISFVMSFYMIRQQGLSPWGVNRKLLLLRGTVGTLGLSLFFYTLQSMPLASAVTIQYLSPLFVTVVAMYWLKEKVTGVQWFSLAMALVGVFMMKGWDPRVSEWDLFLGVGGALASAVAYNTVRVLRKTDHELVVVFYFPLVTLPLIAPWAWTHWAWPTGKQALLILLMGISTQWAQIFLTRAYQRAPASRVSLLTYLGLVYALLIGYGLFNEPLVLGSFLGIGFILLAVGLHSRENFRRSKKEVRSN